MNPLGILGGTFNPIHEGHIQIAERVLHTCDLERIEFIPCYSPPHRNTPTTTPEQRLAMVKLAIQHHAQFSINEFELQQKNTSYTVNTLTHLRAQHPAQSLCLIVGSDAFSHFHKWHQFEKIMTLANLIVVTRNTKNNTYSPLLEKYITTERQRLKDNLAGFIYFKKINRCD